MKISKVLAGMSAAALAASMMSIAASAMDFENELSAGVSFQNDVNAGTIAEWADTSSSITNFSFGEEFTITFDAGEGTFKPANYFAIETGIKQKDANDETEIDQYSFTISSIKGDGEELSFDPEGLDVHFENGLLRCELYKNADWGGKATAYDGSWKAVSKLEITLTIDKEEPAPEEYKFVYPEDAAFGAGGKSWQSVEFDSLKEVEFNAWDGIWWQLDIPTPAVDEGKEPDFFVNTENAKAVIEVKFVEDVAEGSEILRYFDTNDGTEYHAVADRNYAAGEGITVEIPWADVEEALVALEMEDKFWGNGFGGNFQVGVPAIVSSFVTGYSIEDIAPGDESSQVTPESTSEAESKAEESSTAPTDSKKADSSSKAAAAATTTNPGTGAAALAVVGVALAGAAVVTTKKRK